MSERLSGMEWWNGLKGNGNHEPEARGERWDIHQPLRTVSLTRPYYIPPLSTTHSFVSYHY